MAGQVGLLAAGSSYRPRLPGAPSGLCGVRPPFTVAGQRGNYTPFPFHPPVAEPNRNNRPFSYGDHRHLSSEGKLTTRSRLGRRHHRHPEILIILYVASLVVAFVELPFVGKLVKPPGNRDLLPHFLFGKELNERVGPCRSVHKERSDHSGTTPKHSKHPHVIGPLTRISARSL